LDFPQNEHVLATGGEHVDGIGEKGEFLSTTDDVRDTWTFF